MLADGSPLDLDRIVNMLNCRNASACSVSSLAAITAQRPWGANNPVWRLYAYGPLPTLLPEADIDASQYVVVMVADDPSENDGDPRRDGSTETNPGRGVIVLRGEAFGPGGAHQVVEATLARSGLSSSDMTLTGIRVLSWRLLR
jgi:hypothetical protein